MTCRMTTSHISLHGLRQEVMRANCSLGFLEDPDRVLWLAITARNAGQRPSELAGVEDDIAALDFDLACTLRLQQYDMDVAEMQAKRIAHEAAIAMFGDGTGGESDAELV